MTKEQVFLAFDFGTHKIGVAVGQNVTKTAAALTIVKAQKGIPEWDSIKDLINKWNPDALVVGIPSTMDDKAQPVVTKKALNFVKELKKRFLLPVHQVDEKLTTVAAREEVFAQGGFRALAKGPVDATAAKIILEAWFK